MNEYVGYSDVIKFLFSSRIEKYIPDGLFHSYPIIGRHEGRIVDLFFLYSFKTDLKEYNAPLALLCLDTGNEELVFHLPTAERPFSSELLEKSIYVDDNGQDFQTISALQREYEMLYGEVRRIAYSFALSAEQKSTLYSFLKVFNNLVEASLKPFYFELSKDFFDWAIGVFD